MLTTQPVSLYSIVVWAALAVLAGFVQIRLRGLGTQLSVRFFVVLISMAVLNWPQTAAIACLSALVESAVSTTPRPRWTATVLYAAISTLATCAAYATYHIPASGAGVSGPLLMVLAAIVYFAVSSVALARFTARPWKPSFFWTFPHYVAGGSAAGLLTNLVYGGSADRHNGWQITLLVVPMLYWMVRVYKLYLERIEQERRGSRGVQRAPFPRDRIARCGHRGPRSGTSQASSECVERRTRDWPADGVAGDSDLLALRTAALLRNVGKLAVPEHILSKPGPLTKAEFDKMKIHPAAGAQIVEQAGFPYPVAPIVRSSHEKWDGTGYPAGLRGEQIPLGARILAAVDCLDALVSTRGYRRAYSLEEAIRAYASGGREKLRSEGHRDSGELLPRAGTPRRRPGRSRSGRCRDLLPSRPRGRKYSICSRWRRIWAILLAWRKPSPCCRST